MKRFYVFTTFLFVAFGLMAQLNVPTIPQERNVVLEEFTGVNCPYCPDGHVRAKAIQDAMPGRVSIVMIHTGSYANTTPNFQTEFGASLASYMGVNGFPMGAVNRQVFPEVGSSIAMGRGAWAWAAYQVFPEQSPVNVAAQSSYDETTRELTVDVQIYYTKSSPAATNYLQVAFLQDEIRGPQASGGAGDNYIHNHMLRHLITGLWGDEITTTSQGSLIEKTYTWVVPEEIGYQSNAAIPVLIEDCKLAVYVTESKSNIYTGIELPAIDGLNNGETNIYIGDFDSPLVDFKKGVIGEESLFEVKLNNSMENAEEFKVVLTTENMPSGWEAKFIINDVEYSEQAIVEVENGSPQDIEISVIPDEQSGLAKLILTMYSVNNPDASPKQVEVYVISNITDLIVRGSGSWGDGQDYNFDDIYSEVMEATSSTSWSNTTANVMMKAYDADVLGDINNIYMNIGWSFPSLADEEADALMNFLDNGGNVFIAGQDIGWDINDSGGYGTIKTKRFYRDYLHAKFISDGSSSNNKLLAAAYPFLDVGASPITTPYSSGGQSFLYPDEIEELNGSVAVFTYSNTAKKAALRYNNDTYKTFYMGIGLEMIADVEVRKNVFKIVYDWFNGVYNNISEEAIQSLFVGQNYPNPANDYTYIPLNTEENLEIVIFDSMGKLVHTENVKAGTIAHKLSTSHMPAGQYFYQLRSKERSSKTHSLQIVR